MHTHSVNTHAGSPEPAIFLSRAVLGAAIAAVALGGSVAARDFQQTQLGDRGALLLPAVQAATSTDSCPDGWVPSSHPGGCEPGSFTSNQPQRIEVQQLAPTDRRIQSIQHPPGHCSEGWEPGTHPVNPQLGCLPDALTTGR